MVFGNPVFKTIAVELNDDTGAGPFKANLFILVQKAVATTPNNNSGPSVLRILTALLEQFWPPLGPLLLEH
jgi:hypothetical protein